MDLPEKLIQTNPNDTVSAFRKEDEEWLGGHCPLTKREYFAALAMQGLVAANVVVDSRSPHQDIARTAVRLADELIKELNK